MNKYYNARIVFFLKCKHVPSFLWIVPLVIEEGDARVVTLDRIVFLEVSDSSGLEKVLFRFLVDHLKHQGLV